MVKEARPSWSQMSAEQRKPYDLRAKQLHKEMQQIPGEWRRKDNQRQFIDSRADPVQEMEKRRASDRNIMTLELKGCGDLRDKIFYVINFQLLFSDDTLDIRMPVEIGIVRMSLREGILSDVHRIFYPGDVPRGYRSKALDHKNTYHQIPIEYSEADQNLRGLWQQMEEFVFKHVADGEDAPPLFCLSDELVDTEMCLQFLHDASESASRNPFTVRALDDLVFVLLSLTTPGANPAKTQIRDKLLINRWDYCSAIRCSFHENEDCKYCSLSITKRYSFAIFDLLSTTLDFELTRNHLYDDTSTDNMVVRPAVKLGRMNVEPHYTGYSGPSGAPVQNGRTARGRGSARGSGSRPVSPPDMFREPRTQGVPNRFEVCQDSSSEEEDEDPNNSGLHVNDALNVPNAKGEVLVNVGHPDGDRDALLAPQLAAMAKPHQIGGIRFLYDNIIESEERFRGSQGFGCILAHSMGLGKTFQVVAFVDIFLACTGGRKVLCIVPINTIQNWLSEFNYWLPAEGERTALVDGLSSSSIKCRQFPIHLLNDSLKSLQQRAAVIEAWQKQGGW